MKKILVFKAENINFQSEPDSNILWQVKYVLQKDDDILPIHIFGDFDNEFVFDAYPLKYLEDNFKLLNMKKTFDFPYKKEYSFEDDDFMSFTATLIALDINSFHTEVKFPKKFGDKILEDLKIGSSGKMHPEKFHKLLISGIDLSDNKYDKDEKYLNLLTDLEDLCFKCIEYEKGLEWNTISEVKS